jgi:hypothetical protein
MTKKPKVSYRVKHQPARTVYSVQCRDLITLTYPYGAPIHPEDAEFVKHAERRDEPECWELECIFPNSGYVLSSHSTKEEARAALKMARKAPAPKAPIVT